MVAIALAAEDLEVICLFFACPHEETLLRLTSLEDLRDDWLRKAEVISLRLRVVPGFKVVMIRSDVLAKCCCLLFLVSGGD